MRTTRTDQTARKRSLIWAFAGRICQKVRFSQLCLSEIGFLPMWEISISHNHAGPRNNPLKGGRKRIHLEPVHAGLGNLTRGAGISTRGKPRPWLKFLPLMDIHDEFLYSHFAAHILYFGPNNSVYTIQNETHKNMQYIEMNKDWIQTWNYRRLNNSCWIMRIAGKVN